MKKGVMFVVILVAVAFLAMPLTSFAGGTISGKVTYNGKPINKEFSFAKFPNPKFCPKIPNKELSQGDKRTLKAVDVGAGGALKGAVVAVSDIEDQAFIDGYKGTEVVAGVLRVPALYRRRGADEEFPRGEHRCGRHVALCGRRGPADHRHPDPQRRPAGRR